MKNNNNVNLSERASEIGIKIERVSTLMEFMERALEGEVEIEQKKLVSLSYTINDYLTEVTKKFDEPECIINDKYGNDKETNEDK